MKKILLVEDDELIRDSLKDMLEYKGYECVTVCDATETKHTLDHGYDLVILDVQLPDESGIEVCKWIKSKYSIPVLFLSCLNEEDEIVAGLNAGGDDYVTKPFGIKELCARINNLVTRYPVNKDILHIDDLVIDTINYRVFKRDEEIEMSIVTYHILYEFVTNKRVLTRDYLIEVVEDMTDHEVEDNTLSVHIKRLRKLLGTYNGKTYIETLRGVGYRWHL